MDKKRLAAVIASILLLSVGFIFYFAFPVARMQGDVVNNGDRDANGCLIHLGYTWNATEQACVLEWINGTGRDQVTNFTDCVEAGYNLTSNLAANLTNESNITYLQQCETPAGVTFIQNMNSSFTNTSYDNLTDNGSWNGTFNISNETTNFINIS